MTTTRGTEMATSKYLTRDRLITVRRTLTTGLTLIAFGYSYSHTKGWFADHGQTEGAGVLALLPELSILLVALTLALGNMNRVTTWIIRTIGAGSVAITIAANLAGAGPGFGGAVAALVAPVFAILGIALEFSSLVKAPRKATTKPRKAPADRKAPAKAPVKRNRGVIDKGILWAWQQPTWPTAEQIRAEFPTISPSTASRIHNSDKKIPA